MVMFHPDRSVSAPLHLIRVLSVGFSCSCGQHRTDATSRRDAFLIASQHQFASFVGGITAGQTVTTTCLACGARLGMPVSNSEGLMHDYAVWIKQPCSSCGKSPRQVVIDA